MADIGTIDTLCELFNAPADDEESAHGGVEAVDELLGILAPYPQEVESSGNGASSAAPLRQQNERPAARAEAALDRRRAVEDDGARIGGHDIVSQSEALQKPPQAEVEPDLPEPSMGVPEDVIAVPFVVTAQFDLCCEIDTKELAFSIRHAEYNPRKSSCCVVRLYNPKTVGNVRPSGRVTITGKFSEEEIKTAARKIAKLVQLSGYKDVKFRDFRITSFYCKVNLGFPVRLDMLASKWRRNALYEPEQYSGCVFKTRKPKCTYLVTSGGNVMIGGCKSMDEVKECLRRAYPVMHEFRHGARALKFA